MSTHSIPAAHPMPAHDDDRSMSMETHPDCYGPNYRTAKEESRALRTESNLSWFDAWAFALLLMCVLTPVLVFLAMK